MKFSAFFTSPGLRRLSVWLGILTGLIGLIFFDWRLAVAIGAATVLLLSLLLPLLFYWRFLPYRKLKKSLGDDKRYIFDEPVRFTVKSGTVGGFFLLTERSMIFLSLECDTKSMELTRDKVVRVSGGGEDLHIDIYLNNTQFVRVFTGAHEEVLKILREHGWNTVQ